MFEKAFHLEEKGTKIRTEIMAGLTTFLTMAYIIFLNPAVLSTDFTGNPTGLSLPICPLPRRRAWERIFSL